MVKYQEPIRGKSWWALYKKYGFKVFLINEFRTSSVCPVCNSRLEKFLPVKDPRRKNDPNAREVLCHGLLRCQNQKCMWTVPKYDVTTKRRRFNRNRMAVVNFRRIVVSLRETGDIPDIFKPSTPLPDTRKKSNANKSELGEPGTTKAAKGTVSNKPRSTAKRSRKQPVAAPSKTLDSYFERKSATNKQQQQSSPPPSPQSKRLHKGTS
ncbi:hypothetical protein H4S03_007178 [Coemansia sp. S3946]|nr:hypothetical protein H4S03_007178 [Coemansia sp. S3946]KAJ2425476.1 hypothetical protein GGF41_002409 [Coemansia sp. RSA 2531]